MVKILFVIAVILLVSSIVLSGCMRSNAICNYDHICTDGETDDCIDCRDVLGRGLEQQDMPVDTNAANYVP